VSYAVLFRLGNLSKEGGYESACATQLSNARCDYDSDFSPISCVNGRPPGAGASAWGLTAV